VNPQTGQYRRRWVPAGTRRGDAEKLVAELVKRSHQGETVVSEKLTLGEYLTKRWLPVQQARLRTSTYDSYQRNIDLHVIPALGERLLDRAHRRGHRPVLRDPADQRRQEDAPTGRRQGQAEGPVT
jgi:hypothetical protein